MLDFIFLFLLLGATLAMVVYLLRRVSTQAKILRTMKETQTSLIRNLETGLNEISGIVSTQSTPIYSFLENKECIYTELHIYEIRRTGRSSSYHSIFKYTEQGKCILEDESGSCILDLSPEQADFTIVDGANSVTEISEETHKRICALEGSPVDKINSEKRLTFVEVTLYAEENLYVLGDMSVSDSEGMPLVQMNSELQDPQQLYITNRTEKETASSLKKEVLSQRIFAIILLLFVLLFAYIFISTV